MSDQKFTEHYPPDREVIKSFAWVPCRKCGAMIHRPLRGQHVEWHEARRLHIQARAVRVKILALDAQSAHLNRVIKWLWAGIRSKA